MMPARRMDLPGGAAVDSIGALRCRLVFSKKAIMAGDWIPMRTNLEDDPTVIFIARQTKLAADHVVGKLHRFWAWVDSHSEDGSLRGVDAVWVDQYVGKRGFAAAMASAPHPWLEIVGDGLAIPNYPHWFGMSAKRRLTDTKRKQSVRSMSANCPQTFVTETGPPNRTGQNRLLAPALGAVEFRSALDKAKQITERLGSAGSDRNRRLIIGASVFATEIGDEWLDTAVRETAEAHADKPYAYLRAILARTADAAGFDFRASLARLKFPNKQREAG